MKIQLTTSQDYDTYQCYYTSGNINAVGETIRNELTSSSTSDDWDSSGVCAFSVRESNYPLPTPRVFHDRCTTDFQSIEGKNSVTYHLKPSIGTNGQFCVCTQPSSTQYYTYDSDDLSDEFQAKIEAKTDTSNIDRDSTIQTQAAIDYFSLNSNENDEYELYQSHFNNGTFRIMKSGTYKIMENIIFDFNADYNNPNSDTAWWPANDDANEDSSHNIYPGAGDYHDPYFLGFFAGITIESDDVILDLNGYELRMSDTFYHQQRWFTIISLQSQYFLPGQGIGFFGADPYFAKNIIIKNGTLGLTSHHGIHGHFNKHITINNVQVKDFETHGIQLNGFDGIMIENCEIGPNTKGISYFKGEYGHARTLLPRFQKIADKYPNDEIRFYGRDETVTMQDIVDELQKQTDMAYYHVVEGKEYDQDDESWISAQELFLDKSSFVFVLQGSVFQQASDHI